MTNLVKKNLFNIFYIRQKSIYNFCKLKNNFNLKIKTKLSLIKSEKIVKFNNLFLHLKTMLSNIDKLLVLKRKRDIIISNYDFLFYSFLTLKSNKKFKFIFINLLKSSFYLFLTKIKVFKKYKLNFIISYLKFFRNNKIKVFYFFIINLLILKNSSYFFVNFINYKNIYLKNIKIDQISLNILDFFSILNKEKNINYLNDTLRIKLKNQKLLNFSKLLKIFDNRNLIFTNSSKTYLYQNLSFLTNQYKILYLNLNFFLNPIYIFLNSRLFYFFLLKQNLSFLLNFQNVNNLNLRIERFLIFDKFLCFYNKNILVNNNIQSKFYNYSLLNCFEFSNNFYQFYISIFDNFIKKNKLVYTKYFQKNILKLVNQTIQDDSNDNNNIYLTATDFSLTLSSLSQTKIEQIGSLKVSSYNNLLKHNVQVFFLGELNPKTLNMSDRIQYFKYKKLTSIFERKGYIKRLFDINVKNFYENKMLKLKKGFLINYSTVYSIYNEITDLVTKLKLNKLNTIEFLILFGLRSDLNSKLLATFLRNLENFYYINTNSLNLAINNQILFNHQKNQINFLSITVTKNLFEYLIQNEINHDTQILPINRRNWYRNELFKLYKATVFSSVKNLFMISNKFTFNNFQLNYLENTYYYYFPTKYVKIVKNICKFDSLLLKKHLTLQNAFIDDLFIKGKSINFYRYRLLRSFNRTFDKSFLKLKNNTNESKNDLILFLLNSVASLEFSMLEHLHFNQMIYFKLLRLSLLLRIRNYYFNNVYFYLKLNKFMSRVLRQGFTYKILTNFILTSKQFDISKKEMLIRPVFFSNLIQFWTISRKYVLNQRLVYANQNINYFYKNLNKLSDSVFVIFNHEKTNFKTGFVKG